jgi:UDP-glucose 4-epimerase
LELAAEQNDLNLAGKSILVVGGAGFIGSNLARRLLTERAGRIVVIDNLLSAERENLPTDPTIELVEGSIADQSVLDSIVDEFDHIFHLAVYHGNQSSIANPLEDHKNSLLTTLRLYEHIKWFRRTASVVYASSGCTLAPHNVFDGATPVEESGSVPLDLDSPYQISKVVGEFYSVYYHRQHGLPIVRMRFQNVYGPGEILGAGRWRGTDATVWRNVTPTFVYRALKALPLLVDNGGIASRDFIYVDDIVNGMLLAATSGRKGDVYNLASGTETTILELATLINTLTGNPAQIDFRPRRDWDRSVRRLGSTAKALRELGFECHVPIGEGVRLTVEWTLSNLELIDGCVRRHDAHMQLQD